MFDHVGIRVSDRAASRRFYETVLAPLGLSITHSTDEFDEWNDFGIAPARDDRPVTRRLHVAFAARARAEVDAFWNAGTQAGYQSDGEPGLRPEYDDDYYGAFLLDPDGNSCESVHNRGTAERDNVIDHLWIRVADLDPTRRFYDAVVPVLGLRVTSVLPKRFHVAARGSSFALVRGEPTENVHLAFPVADDAIVADFHRVAVSAGYRDNGPPGERGYHPGYYAAFVLDPDGNNVEAVNHNR